VTVFLHSIQQVRIGYRERNSVFAQTRTMSEAQHYKQLVDEWLRLDRVSLPPLSINVLILPLS
jgi:hypothetical protein